MFSSLILLKLYFVVNSLAGSTIGYKKYIYIVEASTMGFITLSCREYPIGTSHVSQKGYHMGTKQCRAMDSTLGVQVWSLLKVVPNGTHNVV